MKSRIGRADLVRLLAMRDREEGVRVADLLGFERLHAEVVGKPKKVRERTSVEAEPPAPVPMEAEPLAPVPFFIPERIEYFDAPKKRKPSGAEPFDLRPWKAKRKAPPQEPLAPWSRLLPLVEAKLRVLRPARDLETRTLVDAWSRGLRLRDLPRRMRRRWPNRLEVWIDRSLRLVPFWSDQDQLLAWLARRGAGALRVRVILDSPPANIGAERCLVLGDLGAYGTRADRLAWAKTARIAERAGVGRLALLPVPKARFGSAARLWCGEAWERARGPGAQDQTAREARVHELLALLSFTTRVEPALLRAVRRGLGARADAGTEADLWAQPSWSAGATGAAWRAKEALRWREQLVARGGGKELAEVVAKIAEHHGDVIPAELWNEELTALAELERRLGVSLLSAAQQREQQRFAASLEASIDEDGRLPEALARYWRRAFEQRLGAKAVSGETNPLARVTQAALRDEARVELPLGLGVEDMPAEDGERAIFVRQSAGDLIFVPGGAAARVGESPVLMIVGGEHVQIEAAQGALRFRVGAGTTIPIAPDEGIVPVAPDLSWANRSGRDEQGWWAERIIFAVPVRFRWMDPQGCWLAERPCSGRLLRAATKKQANEVPGRVALTNAVDAIERIERAGYGTFRLPTWKEWKPLRSPVEEWLAEDVAAALKNQKRRARVRLVRDQTADERSPSMTILTHRTRTRLATFERPSWAAAAGRDRFGLFAILDLEGMELKLRYIPPGRFTMGSPPSEAGHDERESPAHRVTIEHGYWLSETPITQWFWTRFNDVNPSRFVSPDRPVESLSWKQCERFIFHLNKCQPELSLRLPTEAEWEYACRAGTTTATWAGELDIRGERDAPLLDPIAWYGGNCGVGFELSSGRDVSKWPKVQYRSQLGGTHPVRKKAPNPWGLYDMLGNVAEWCADSPRVYRERDEVDPSGPPDSTPHVARGGAWSYRAGNVRAASRQLLDPSLGLDFVGFRVAAEKSSRRK